MHHTITARNQGVPVLNVCGYVTWLQINLCTIPLVRTYAALETLTEPHQVTATLQCVTGVSRTLLNGGDGRQVLKYCLCCVPLHLFMKCVLVSHHMGAFNLMSRSKMKPICVYPLCLYLTFRYPEGRAHLFSLLTLALPGIDPNDFRKTLVRSI